jgi:hypothetical protein
VRREQSLSGEECDSGRHVERPSSSGLPKRSVEIAGDEHQAAFVVAVLDLELFVDARVNARLN